MKELFKNTTVRAYATALAQVGVSIFVLSSYSTDHILVKADQHEQTIAVLSQLGCRVIDETARQ